MNSLTCSCTGTPSGSVWGSGPYTDDSDICSAARHAGLIGDNGGDVYVVRGASGSGYTGSVSNGITTNDWPDQFGSMNVYKNGDIVPDTPAKKALEACRFLPSGVDTLSCSCAGAPSGSVWGSGPYTADSDICSAAQHAGVIGNNGGNVRVVRGSTGSDYSGSARNGITTISWSSQAGSMDVYGNDGNGDTATGLASGESGVDQTSGQNQTDANIADGSGSFSNQESNAGDFSASIATTIGAIENTTAGARATGTFPPQDTDMVLFALKEDSEVEITLDTCTKQSQLRLLNINGQELMSTDQIKTGYGLYAILRNVDLKMGSYGLEVSHTGDTPCKEGRGWMLGIEPGWKIITPTRR